MNLSAFAFFLLALSAFVASCDAADNYWISFTGPVISSNSASSPSSSIGGPKYLMKIDALGNILEPARLVIRNSRTYVSPVYGATAISENDSLLNMWMPAFSESIHHRVFRAMIRKDTLEVTAFIKTDLQVRNDYNLQVTQRPESNLLVMEDFVSTVQSDTLRYLGAPLSNNGTVIGKRVELSPQPVSCPCEVGISADGKILFFNDAKFNSSGVETALFTLQRLDLHGNPIGHPEVIAKGRLVPTDISNILPTGYRLALFRGLPPLTLYVMPISNESLQRIGAPIRIASQTDIASQSAAIDPYGHFVVYKRFNTPYLFFQALDALAHPSGKPKMISDKVGSGIDILKESDTTKQ